MKSIIPILMTTVSASAADYVWVEAESSTEKCVRSGNETAFQVLPILARC